MQNHIQDILVERTSEKTCDLLCLDAKKTMQKDILVDPWRASAYIGEDLREECDNLARSHKPLPGRASWPERDDDDGEDDGDDDDEDDGDDDDHDDHDDDVDDESTATGTASFWKTLIITIILIIFSWLSWR